LYGPPGAGKTHTTRYAVQQLADTTVLLLPGQSLNFIGMVTTLARELQPSAVVLEDVDLVAEDRGFGPLDVVTAVHVSRALDDLLESGQAVTGRCSAFRTGTRPSTPAPAGVTLVTEASVGCGLAARTETLPVLRA
jgi:AAA+ superfamily predicted ATPase